MLVSFPIGFYTLGFISLIAYAATASEFAFRLAYVAILAGVAIAIPAAVLGFIDFTGTPQGTPARRTAVKHLGFNLLATLLFAGAGLMLLTDAAGMPTLPRNPAHSYIPALVIASVAFACMGVAGWLGWKLVQTHHVGVDDRPQAIREAPRTRHARHLGAHGEQVTN
jgi:uncharacterized membrane protein